jgi:transcription elongation factor GreA
MYAILAIVNHEQFFMQIPYRKPGQFSNIPLDPVVTQQKFNELKNKLEKLKYTTRPQAAKEVARLAELGDFSENAEYQLAKGRLRGINNTISKLEAHLNIAVIIPDPDQDNDTIQIGSVVTIESSGVQKTYQILGSSETNPVTGVISYSSPVGAALIGHHTGEEVSIQIGPKKIIYKIIRIASK